jgi:hypothetical protein
MFQPPTAVPPPVGPAGNLNALYRLAAERYLGIDGYIVRLTRREQVGGKNHPAEILVLKYRKSPWSVYLMWIGAAGKGRELTYVRGEFGDTVHLKPGAGDASLLALGGNRLSLPPDSPRLRALSRHSLSETGIGASIARFGILVDAAARGDLRRGSMKYLGLLKRPEFAQPVEGVLHAIPAGVEPDLPRGGQRWWFFDTNLRLPVLMITENDRGDEVEYYCYDKFRFPGTPLSEDDFDPDVLWGR